MMDRSNRLIVGLAVLAASIGGYVQHRGQQPDRSAESALVGRPLPAMSLSDLDGRLHRLQDYRGRRTVLNFWASWCGPCLDEMPELARAQAKFGANGATIVGIAMDEPAHVQAFVAAHPLNYPMLLGRLEAPSTAMQLGDRDDVLPYSVLVSADGQVLATHIGALSSTQLQQWMAGTARVESLR